MEKQVFKTENEWLDARKNVITSTEIPALFGVYKYGNTKYNLWCKKKGLIDDDFKTNERIEIGRHLEYPIADYFCKKNGWAILNADEKYALYSCRKGIAASIDFVIDDGNGPGIGEVKNVDGMIFHKEWTKEEAPLHIELQLQFQLMNTEMETGKILALVGGNQAILMEREHEKTLQKLILEESDKFWES